MPTRLFGVGRKIWGQKRKLHVDRFDAFNMHEKVDPHRRTLRANSIPLSAPPPSFLSVTSIHK